MKPPKKPARPWICERCGHNMLSALLRWAVPPKAPSMLAKPDPHLVRGHAPVPPNVDRGT